MPLDHVPSAVYNEETNLRLAINTIITEMVMSNEKVSGFIKRTANRNNEKVSIVLQRFDHCQIMCIISSVDGPGW